MNNFDHLFLTVTNKCNMQCRHCYLSASPSKSDEIETKHLLSVIDQAAELGLGKLHVDGGEALLHSNLFDVLDYAADKGIPPSLCSNALLIDDIVLARLHGKIRKLVFSLDGACAETHDWLRAEPGSFDKVIEAIKLSTKFNIDIDLITVVSNKNISEIDAIVELAKNLGVNLLTFFAMDNLGRAKDIWDDVMVSAEDWTTYLNKVALLKKDNPWVLHEPAWVPDGSGYSDHDEYMCVSKKNNILFVDPMGDVYKCPFFIGSGITLGNIKKDRIEQILNNDVIIDKAPNKQCGCPAYWLKLHGVTHYSGPGGTLRPICYWNIV